MEKRKNIKYADIKNTILNSKKEIFKNSNELNERLSYYLNETLNYHYVSDVPITVLLSAGIDSV